MLFVDIGVDSMVAVYTAGSDNYLQGQSFLPGKVFNCDK